MIVTKTALPLLGDESTRPHVLDSVAGVLPDRQHDIALVARKDGPRVDSRLLAKSLGNQHKNVMELVERHKTALERFGKVPFQTEALSSSRTGQRQKFALLNEHQALLLLALSRNSDRVVQLKGDLIAAFAQVRELARQHDTEYIPGYRELHDAIGFATGDSPNAKFVHMNCNKLANQFAGINAGKRRTASTKPLTMLTLANEVIAKAMHGTGEHHGGYALAKQQLHAIAKVLTYKAVEVPHD